MSVRRVMREYDSAITVPLPVLLQPPAMMGQSTVT